MQKQQVFKVKGMQRDASMANANGEFAYEILNMRLMPAEDLSGFSLTNEKGTTQVITGKINGQVIGQCPTNDSLVVFTKDSDNDYIYEIYQDDDDTWKVEVLYSGNLNFSVDNPIEALFNYETKDIQKVYWIDGINQLRCINLEEIDTIKKTWNDQSFDSIKKVETIPLVTVERIEGGNFTAGILQYYVTYFNKFASESPIVYVSPLLYLAHHDRGAAANDMVSTAFKLTLSNLDKSNWGYIKIYCTHRASLDGTPEASLIGEYKIDETGTIDITDFGLNRVSIAPTDLYFTGGKFLKVGTMTTKDQVLFLGNLKLDDTTLIDVDEIQSVFDSIRDSDNYLKTDTFKTISNDLSQYEETSYFYKNNLNNVSSITHYKYGEKYRFGISLLDKYGQWSTPIWIKDAFIEVAPMQKSGSTLALPCPTLNLTEPIIHDGKEISLLDYLKSKGVVNIRPLVVFPTREERKVIAQGVVCPTVYNLKDRKENGPYAQASWFMRPNAPVDLWGISGKILGKEEQYTLLKHPAGSILKYTSKLNHKSDLIPFPYSGQSQSKYGYYGVAYTNELNNGLSPFDYVHDDFSVSTKSTETAPASWEAEVQLLWKNEQGYAEVDQLLSKITSSEQRNVYSKGNWIEFRHNYALRSKGWSFGFPTPKQTWDQNFIDQHGVNWGMSRCAEIETSQFSMIPPVNRFDNRGEEGVETVTLSGDEIEIDNVYFCTIESPKTVSAYDEVTLYVFYKYTDPKTNKQYLIPVKQYRRALVSGVYRPNVYLNVDTKGNSWTEFLLKIKYQAEPQQLISEGQSYYIWEVRDISLLKKQEYIDLHIPEVTIYLDKGEEDLWVGSTDIGSVAVGNSSYYVDNSIVTLNSPEIEISPESFNLSDTDFRIIGMIPLTATSSDISLISESTNLDSSNLGVGLHKQTLSNKNIGFQGFKGIVSANGYLSRDDTRNLDTFYSMTPLYPWQSTGTLGTYVNTSTQYKTKDLLKRKILSNLRYSASSYYFGPDSLFFAGSLVSDVDHAYNNGHVIGWKPGNGCKVDTFNGESSEDIVKLFNLGYSKSSLVYKGNIDTIALSTKGNEYLSSSTSVPVFGEYPSVFSDEDSGEIVTNSSGNLDVIHMLNSPAASAQTTLTIKQAKGASIKYKSSPHFVIGFNCFDSLWGSNKKIQETLPAWAGLNEEGLSSLSHSNPYCELNHRQLYEDSGISSLYHQNYINVDSATFGLSSEYIPSRYDEYQWGSTYSPFISLGLGNFNAPSDLTIQSGDFIWNAGKTSPQSIVQLDINSTNWKIAIDEQRLQTPEGGWGQTTRIVGGSSSSVIRYSTVSVDITIPENVITSIKDFWINKSFDTDTLKIEDSEGVKGSYVSSWEGVSELDKTVSLDIEFKSGSQTNRNIKLTVTFSENLSVSFDNLTLLREVETSSVALPNYGWLWLGEVYRKQDPTFGGDSEFALQNNLWELAGEAAIQETEKQKVIEGEDPDEEVEFQPISIHEVRWTQGDTYYQRFDTLKTYAYSDSDENSVVDITSFMVETHINIDGRTDRNRGQESNLQMSPTNFNLMNDIYSQRDNFFTYRILDDDAQARTNFPNQITWSLTKTAGATVDAWMNITLASVLDLDGTKGKISALKNFNNNIIAFQEKGLSHIMFNSRAQIATSEAVPIQIANTGKVDGQQYFTTDIGCQDKWNIVTTPNGLYFVDYFNKSIYRFNGQLEDISTPNGFRSWCYENLNSTANILGYYDIKNKEVMYYIGDTGFTLDQQYKEIKVDGTISLVNIKPTWLGFSELTGAFSSFYTYPKAWFANVQDQGLWLLSGDTRTTVFTHQTGNYNQLLGSTASKYGLTVIPRQDSNTVKTFNNVEFRADFYNGNNLDDNHHFDTISAETEYQTRTPNPLTYSQYRPSNLKKKFRTWRANIPRVNNGYNRFVNQWAKIGLWKMNPSTEKTILHDLSVWYSE